MQPVKRITLEDLPSRSRKKGEGIEAHRKRRYAGLVEALVSSLKGLETQDIKLDIVHAAPPV